MIKRGLVYGVGINDADYNVVKREKVDGKWKVTWRCAYYVRWVNMLKRCYSKRYQEKRPTYKGHTVCEEWLTFSAFKKWMETQEWECRQLDKDFLIENNKVYSPTTCVFLPNILNSFIVTSGKRRGIYPLGVYYMKKHKKMVSERSKPYQSSISDQKGNQIDLGYYSTPEEAHKRYLTEKLKQCADHIEEFKYDIFIVKGLERIKTKIQHHIDKNLELTEF